jgi:hypothetical protein
MNGLGKTLDDILDRYDHRATDPATSVIAAEENRPRRRTQRQQVLDNIVDAWRHGRTGCTDFEHAPIQQTSAGKRRGELVTLGLVEASTSWRYSPAHAVAIVWTPTEDGIAQAAGPR